VNDPTILDCVRCTQFSVIQIIHCNVGLKCFLSFTKMFVSCFVIIVIQGGPKNQTCLRVDNSVMVSGRKTCIRQMFQNAVKNKRQIWIVKHLNILCLICINIHQPQNSAKFDTKHTDLTWLFELL